jgi:hypothetical protein
MDTKCLFCGNAVHLIFVHGHYQCPVCNTNALPCCDGDNCHNAFLSVNANFNTVEDNTENNTRRQQEKEYGNP